MDHISQDFVYRINHKFRDEIIVPFVAINNNVEFIFSASPKTVCTGDGTMAEVVESEERHLLTLEMDIRRLYGISAWDFLKRWYSTYPSIDSLHFLKIRLKKL